MGEIRVLVIDDYVASGESLRLLLKVSGDRVDVVTSAADARAALRSNSYDVLVIDYAMDDDVNGLEMLRWCRENGIDTPALIVSGHDLTQVSKVIDFETLGPAEVLVKAVDPDVLVDKINSMAKIRSIT
jgi:DNA-binding response OmpR family regulator